MEWAFDLLEAKALLLAEGLAGDFFLPLTADGAKECLGVRLDGTDQFDILHLEFPFRITTYRPRNSPTGLVVRRHDAPIHLELPKDMRLDVTNSDARGKLLIAYKGVFVVGEKRNESILSECLVSLRDWRVVSREDVGHVCAVVDKWRIASVRTDGQKMVLFQTEEW